jgi:dipeptidyl aminopeptidase/acylaminoacyl peptidase
LTIATPPKPPSFNQLPLAYVSQHGEPLTAVVTLPRGYVSGKAYPAIVLVYLGQRVDSAAARTPAVLDTDAFYETAAYYCSLGFVSIQPSMPSHLDDAHVNPIDELTDGVTPAIDQAIRLGMVDSTRIGLVGHSFGGFSAVGLLTKTKRFRAAAAMAAPVDLTGMYGTFYHRERVGGLWPEYWEAQASTLETGQFNLRATPWDEPERYVYNSPLQHVQQIVTPLLIIQGDEDFVPIAQGEQLYSALLRLGRPVEFARYRGQGHEIYGFAAEVDLDARLARWFERYLGPTVP